jgi:hypothetical protein
MSGRSKSAWMGVKACKSPAERQMPATGQPGPTSAGLVPELAMRGLQASAVLALQRAAGNRAVGQALSRRALSKAYGQPPIGVSRGKGGPIACGERVLARFDDPDYNNTQALDAPVFRNGCRKSMIVPEGWEDIPLPEGSAGESPSTIGEAWDESTSPIRFRFLDDQGAVIGNASLEPGKIRDIQVPPHTAKTQVALPFCPMDPTPVRLSYGYNCA